MQKDFDFYKKLLEDNRPPVLFKEEEHEYWLDDNWLGNKQLNGITGRINDVLYGGNKYAGVPEYIMERARMRGSLIHKEIEDYCVSGILGFTDELQRFIELQEEHGFKVLANEYTVTDFKQYATNIDLIVYNNKEEIELCDIKSTAKLDEEYLSWQLSINAYMLEKIINMPITKLSAYWTRSGEIVNIERKSNEQVQEFLYTDNIALEPQDGLELSKEQAERFTSLQVEISRLKSQLKELENTENEFKQVFMEKMKENNIKSFDLGSVKITYVAPTTRKSLDSKKLERENKEVYEQYLKESDVKESLRITVRRK